MPMSCDVIKLIYCIIQIRKKILCKAILEGYINGIVKFKDLNVRF